MKDIESAFPSNIDKLMLFSDMRLRDSQTYEEYQEKIKKSEYDKAATVLQNADADYYGAYIFNKFNRKLLAIENYIKNKTKPEQPIYNITIPSNPHNNQIWIGDIGGNQ